MSKLAIYTDVAEFYTHNAVLGVPCTADEHVQFAERIGEVVLIGHVDQSGSAQYVAIGRLVRFDFSGSQLGVVQIDQINALPKPALAFISSDTDETIVEISDDDFGTVLRETSDMLDEATGLFQQAENSGVFMDQLGRQTEYRCAFSGVYTADAMATIIRPIAQGGQNHIGNFLYLDREVSASFSNFHWTVGADMEIILNTHLLMRELLEIVIPSGRLAVSKGQIELPDPEALAWHRAAFFARIDGPQWA